MATGIGKLPIIHRLLTTVFAALFLLCTTLLVFRIGPNLHIETDLSALLPENADNSSVLLANRQIVKNNEDRFVLVLSGDNYQQVVAATEMSISLLGNNPSISLEHSLSGAGDNITDVLYSHRFHLLTLEQQQRLTHLTPDQILSRAQASFFGLGSWFQYGEVKEDPLGLFNEWLLSLAAANGNITPQQGFVLIEPTTGNLVYSAIEAQLTGGSLDLTAQQTLEQTVADIEDGLTEFSNVRLARSGVVFHAAEAARNAKREITIISLGSLFGIVALFYLLFRSALPFLLGVGSITVGCYIAFVITHLVFGQVHLLTLVFGASLTGVVVDYALHYMAHASVPLDNAPRLSVLDKLLPGLGMGLVTSAIGYACLAQAPLPGLKQIAVFSVVGLAGAWLFVVCCFPLFSMRPLSTQGIVLQQRLQSLVGKIQRIALPHRLLTIVALLVSALVLCFLLLQKSEDIRALYVPSAGRIADDQLVQNILPGYSVSQYFLIIAEQPQQVLEQEEHLRNTLDVLIDDGELDGYLATTQFVPSVAQQRMNYQQLSDRVYGDNGIAYSMMAALGFDKESRDALKKQFLSQVDDYLSPEQLLSDASPTQPLWLPLPNGQFATAVLLKNPSSLAALQSAVDSVDGAVFVDRVSDLSAVMNRQSHAAVLQLTLAYLVILAVVWLRYRRLMSTLIVLAPLAATVVLLALLSLARVPITMFHLFALFLILGLGLDYGIFIKEAKQQHSLSLLAIVLSAATSCLSFGLLSLSSTPMVSAFGLSVLLGSALNLIFAIALMPSNEATRI